MYTVFIAGEKFHTYESLNDAYKVREFLRQFYKFKQITIKVEDISEQNVISSDANTILFGIRQKDLV